MNNLSVIPFAFEDKLVRIVMLNGEPWFVARDVCDVLGLVHVAKSLSRLDDDERGVHTVHTLGGDQQMSIISESGLYALIFTSRKPEARVFRKWVTAEVLPALRKTGVYDMRPAMTAAKESSRWDPEAYPIEQIYCWLAIVAEMRKSKGRRAASALWDLLPLPAAVETKVDENCEAVGLEVLQNILEAEHNDRTVADWLREAIEGDAAARRTLGPIGILVREDHDGVAFACTTAFFARLFAGQSPHYFALGHIAGARKFKGYFGGEQKRGVLVPLDVVDLSVNGIQAVA
ncbi:MAG: BRO-N domain-containing protein [Methylocystis sp.]